MVNLVPWENFPEIEMHLFSLEYPCYLTMQIVTSDKNGEIRTFFYETENVNNKWLLKTY